MADEQVVNDAMADYNEAIETEVPKFKVTTSTAPANASLDRLTIGNYLLSNVNWEEAEERDKGRGPYHTTTQMSWLMQEDSDDPEFTYQIGLSINRTPKRAEQVKGKAAPVENEAFKLSNHDMIALNSAIGKFKQAGDIDNTVKLATIKSVFERDGRVSRKDFLIVAALQ